MRQQVDFTGAWGEDRTLTGTSPKGSLVTRNFWVDVFCFYFPYEYSVGNMVFWYEYKQFQQKRGYHGRQGYNQTCCARRQG
jgi:hypothetical protein